MPMELLCSASLFKTLPVLHDKLTIRNNTASKIAIFKLTNIQVRNLHGRE